MKKCNSCIFWEKDPKSIGPLGQCENPQFSDMLHEGIDQDNAVIYSFAEGGSFNTGKNFGCIHHKSMEDYLQSLKQSYEPPPALARFRQKLVERYVMQTTQPRAEL